MTEKDMLYVACKNKLDFSVSLSDEYYYSSLPLCLIDAIFSIGVKYSSVKNVVKRYCKKYNVTRINRSRPLQGQHTITNLKENISSFASPEKFTRAVLKNSCRLSPRSQNSILKITAVKEACDIFIRNQIETLQDFNQNFDRVENDFCRINGLQSGVAFDYLKMLAGDDNSIKFDRMIKRFVEKAIEHETNKEEATTLLNEVCNILKNDYPDLSPRLLDHMIWRYQRQQ